MHERGRRVVARRRAVGVQEDDGEVPRTQTIEIHRQEPDIGHRVAEPQSVVEFETVDDPRTVGQKVDVRGDEVAVPVDDPAGVDPRLQQRAAPAKIGIREGRDVVDDLRRIPAHGEPTQVLEGVGPQPADRLRLPRRVDLRGVGAACVQLRDLPGHLTHATGDIRIANPAAAGLPVLHQAGETETVRESTHPHDVVEDLVVVGITDLQYSQIHVRGEPPVQLHLPAALPPTRADGPVVEETQIDRLADFMSLVTTEEDERAVGFHHDGWPPRPGNGPVQGVHNASVDTVNSPRR